MSNDKLKRKVDELRINVKDWRIDLDAGVFDGMPEDVWAVEDLLEYIDTIEPSLTKAKEALGKIRNTFPAGIDHGNYNTSECENCISMIELATEALQEIESE